MPYHVESTADSQDYGLAVARRPTSWVHQFLVAEAIHIVVFAFFLEQARPEILYLSGALALILYGRLLYDRVCHDPLHISPIICYLISSCLRLGIGTLYIGAVYQAGFYDVLQLGRSDTIPYLMHGHFLLLLGDWMFLAGYFLWDRLHPTGVWEVPALTPQSASRMLRTANVMIAAAWGLRLAKSCGMDLRGIGNFYSYFDNYALPAGIFLLLFVANRGRRNTSLNLYAALLLLAEISKGLHSYMKQSVVVAVLPLVIYLAIGIRTSFSGVPPRWMYKRVFAAGAILVFVVFILFPYSQTRRAEYWSSGSIPDVMPFLIGATKAAIPGTTEFAETHRFPENGIWSFCARNAWTREAAWAYGYVAEYGTMDGQWIKEALPALIPRVLWPGKPAYSPGRDLAVLMGQARDFESATSATGLSMAASLYWNGGYGYLVAGMLVNGVLFALVWQLFRPTFFHNGAGTLVCMSMFVEGLRWFESALDGNLTYYAYVFVVFLPFVLLLRQRTADAGESAGVLAAMPSEPSQSTLA